MANLTSHSQLSIADRQTDNPMDDLSGVLYGPQLSNPLCVVLQLSLSKGKNVKLQRVLNSCINNNAIQALTSYGH